MYLVSNSSNISNINKASQVKILNRCPQLVEKTSLHSAKMKCACLVNNNFIIIFTCFTLVRFSHNIGTIFGRIIIFSLRRGKMDDKM